MGTPDLYPIQTKVWVTQGPITCYWYLKRLGQSYWTQPLACRVCTISWLLVSESTKIVGHSIGVHTGVENCLMWKTHIFGVRSVMSRETVFLLWRV